MKKSVKADQARETDVANDNNDQKKADRPKKTSRFKLASRTKSSKSKATRAKEQKPAKGKSAFWAKATDKNISYRQAFYYVAAFGLMAATLVMFLIHPYHLSYPLLSTPYNIYRLVIMSLAVIFVLLAFKSSWLDIKTRKESPRIQKAMHWLGIIVPIVGLVACIIALVNPLLAVKIIRKETHPFYRTGIFIKFAFDVVSLVCFIRLAIYAKKKHKILPLIVAILLALVLFMMAGEELSWGQRIFHWATPESYRVRNAQGETNLHNTHTQLFQNALYLGGWCLLAGLSFFADAFAKFFKKTKHLKFLADWMPSTELILIFGLGFTFTDAQTADTGAAYGSNFFIVLSTFILLITKTIKAIHDKDKKMTIRCTILTVMYAFMAIGNIFFSKVWYINRGVPTEYMEVHIAWGIMLWALTIVDRVLPKKIKNSRTPTKRIS